MACAETSCGHDDQEVQQIREFSHLMEQVTGHTFQQLAALTRVSQKRFKQITVCDLDHIVLL
jgi:hypothetical protein